jgi:hypothetical protein
MTKQTEKTEVVKIRLGSSEKSLIEFIARKNDRTFAGQVRAALKEWLFEIEGFREEPVCDGKKQKHKELVASAQSWLMDK